jgi:hypothetical protein
MQGRFAGWSVIADPSYGRKEPWAGYFSKELRVKRLGNRNCRFILGFFLGHKHWQEALA